MKNKTSRRLAAIAGLAGVTTIALSSMGAGGAAAGALPGGTATQKLIDGTSVTVTLKDEFVNIQPSTVALPTSRNVWLSGKVLVDIAGEADGATVDAGYIVGCQLNFGAGGEGALGLENAAPATPGGERVTTPGGEAGLGFSLQPGKATTVPVIQGGDDDPTNFTFEGNQGGIAYSQETFRIDGCAGFAEAKAYVNVTVETPSVTGIVTLWGKPFSIG
ncbi:MspA family porin [Gordonia rubripertincta]|uniref:MspA family porin n=1 Tax=Gordonia rubripertincta TaxID=36822 RepID=A0ABT4MZR5_GORRU|nr:MspA family porin [Gordonia rubripertincta]MCZ4552493.1 MspA family porin [Gordonia rubripertincta]